jgi:hypothetical protein
MQDKTIDALLEEIDGLWKGTLEEYARKHDEDAGREEYTKGFTREFSNLQDAYKGDRYVDFLWAASDIYASFIARNEADDVCEGTPPEIKRAHTRMRELTQAMFDIAADIYVGHALKGKVEKLNHYREIKDEDTLLLIAPGTNVLRMAEATQRFHYEDDVANRFMVRRAEVGSRLMLDDEGRITYQNGLPEVCVHKDSLVNGHVYRVVKPFE